MKDLRVDYPVATDSDHAISNVLTKQGFGLWSRCKGRNGFVLRDGSDEAKRASGTKQVVESASGKGPIAGYTVVYERG